jgi:hypothetical protein
MNVRLADLGFECLQSAWRVCAALDVKAGLLLIFMLGCGGHDTVVTTNVGAAVQSTKFIVGIIIAVICSNWVGEVIHSDGVYETDLEAEASVIFLRASPPPALFAKTAGDIACKAVWFAGRAYLH